MSVGTQLRAVERGMQVIAGYPEWRNTPIILGESDPEGCGACLGPQNAYRNGPLYGASVTEATMRTYELARRNGVTVEGAVTWAFEFENQPAFAGFRALATDGIDKPVLNVFRLLGMLGGGNRPGSLAVAGRRKAAAPCPSIRSLPNSVTARSRRQRRRHPQRQAKSMCSSGTITMRMSPRRPPASASPSTASPAAQSANQSSAWTRPTATPIPHGCKWAPLRSQPKRRKQNCKKQPRSTSPRPACARPQWKRESIADHSPSRRNARPPARALTRRLPLFLLFFLSFPQGICCEADQPRPRLLQDSTAPGNRLQSTTLRVRMVVVRRRAHLPCCSWKIGSTQRKAITIAATTTTGK